MIFFACTDENLVPINHENVRWLAKDTDYELARHYWNVWGQTLSFSTWEKAHEYGYQYAAIMGDERIISSAGVWRFSEECWETAAVSTLESYRGKGYSKSVFSFITSYILKSGRVATCSTSDDNVAMIATAKSVGYQEVPAGKVWWNYPQLPDF
jgi:RimJ/RimL family protein N-acetyltransferase